MKQVSAHPARRLFLQGGLMSAISLGLRSSASGIPVPILKNPLSILRARGYTSRQSQLSPQYLVISCSDSGDPLNSNAPGMYIDPKFVHPTDPRLTATSFELGTTLVKAALPWASLGATTLQRTGFFHHGTFTFGHGDLHAVQALHGGVSASELFFSAFSKRLQPLLQTIQPQPITIANSGAEEQVSFSGQTQPSLSPTAVRDLLTTPTALKEIGQLQKRRDQDLDALNKLVRAKGTLAQRNLIDYWAQSQTQARSMSQSILSGLSALQNNSLDSAFACAILIVQLKLSPVMTVHIPFGGDNHLDIGFASETNDLISSTTSIAKFQASLASSNLSDSVTLASLNVFGRDNSNPSANGRGHNGDHSCNFIIGANVKGGVAGGASLNPTLGRPQAQTIDSTTGASSANGGDIAMSETLAAYGKTVGAALGIDQEDIDQDILEGKTVSSLINR